MALNQDEDEKLSPNPDEDEELSADEDEKLSLSTFVKGFSPPLLHIQPKEAFKPWVFWSENEGSQNHSSSSSSVDPPSLMLFHNIKSAFSEVFCDEYELIRDEYELILQLWAPVTIGGRLLLSTSAQPFAVSSLDNNLKKYRLHSVRCQYNIDVNMQLCNIDDEEEEPRMILSGGPASAFLNRLPELVFLEHHQESPLARYALECGLENSIMLPICSTSEPSSCIAVVEASSPRIAVMLLEDVKMELKAVGLGVFDVQQRIPYKDINGLKSVKEQIEAALENICESLRLDLAQVWIACEDKNHVPFSSSLGDTQTKRILALKLTDYRNSCLDGLLDYSCDCDMFSLKAGVEPVVKTLQDYKPRFCEDIEHLRNAMPISSVADYWFPHETSALIICLRIMETDDFNYAFEFMWHHDIDSCYLENDIMLEALLLKLNRCMPCFNFASGAELFDELRVIDVENSTDTENKFLKIFERKRVSPMSDALEKGKKPMLVDHSARSKAKHKTAPKLLSQEEIEQQFGKTMKEAAENLKDTVIEFLKIFQRSGVSPMSDVLKKGNKYKTARIELSREVIEQQFGNTQKVAARNLNVHLSTLKRKCKEFHNFEWQGQKAMKRKAVHSCNYQSNRNEEDNGAIQESSVVVNRNKNTLTIKAVYGDDMIKFTIHISEATFVNVEKEISKRFKMTPGTYKLKYHYENEWILLTCDEDLSDCIKSMRNVRLLVISSPQ